MKEIGSEHLIIATDAGQTQNPYWYESFGESIRYMAEHGASNEDLDAMVKRNDKAFYKPNETVTFTAADALTAGEKHG